MRFEIENGVLKKYYEEEGETKVVIPDGVTSIGDYAFWDCGNLTEIIIPDSVTSIGNCTFWNCENLTEIIIPDSVTNIGNGAFYECKNLKKIIIPGSVTSIDGDAFNGCENLKEITIPNSVTSIGGWAFYGTKWLEEYPDDFVIVGNNILIKYKGSDEKVTIPDSVTSIGEYALNFCENFTEIIIPDSVTSIGDCAFWNCENLKEIIIPDSVTSIGDGAFKWCENLKKITFYGVTFEPKKLEYYDFFKAIEMLKTKDFSKKLNSGAKNTVIVGYYLKTEDETAEAFIKKGFARIFKWLIDNEDVETVIKLLNTGKFVTKKNIDKFIDYAIGNKKMEIQSILENYKNQYIG